jgi:mannose-6-phosphate isomerase-like protein (cupin superfamily)
MADYSRVNFEDIESFTEDPDYELRFGRKHMDSRDLGVSRYRIAAGVRSPFAHRHREQEEAYVVVSGSGRALIEDEVIDLRQWDLVRVAAGVGRAFEGGPQGMELIAIGGPKPEGGDGERAELDWPD